MDKKCFNEENTLFFRALKLLKIDIKRYQEMDDLSEDLEELSEQQKPVILICSASLKKDLYEKLVKMELFQEIILYCRHSERGEELKKKHEKISKVFTKDDILIDFITGKDH